MEREERVKERCIQYQRMQRERDKKTELHLAKEKNEDFCKLALRDVI